jgi:hypothetical protein
VGKHLARKNRRMWWQIRLEYRHRWDAFKRDVAYDWRWFWADVKEWRNERKDYGRKEK